MKANKMSIEYGASRFHILKECDLSIRAEKMKILIQDYVDKRNSRRDRMQFLSACNLAKSLEFYHLNIYDIPDKWDTATRLSTVGMLVDALDHAENNLSIKRKGLSQSFKVPLLNVVMLHLELLLLGLIILYLSSYFRRDQVPEWHNIRHLWLG